MLFRSQLAELHGADVVPADVLAAAKEQVRGEQRTFVTSADELPVVSDHKRTGKEYQPSYWYFHDYPADPKDKSTFTPLKRVDRAVYQYLNAQGWRRCALRWKTLTKRSSATWPAGWPPRC